MTAAGATDGTSIDEVLRRAASWCAVEPDDDIRAELEQMIGEVRAGDEEKIAALTHRFSGRLQFGTAGLRAAVAAGPMRMNRLVIRQAAAGLGRWLITQEASGAIPGARRRGVVIAHDARRKSDLFAVDTARVLAAHGIRSMMHDGMQPTPLLAWSIKGLDAAAGVVVTASHNPPADNGYKVFLETGSQIVSPVDDEISAEIAQVDPLTVELAPLDDPLIEQLESSWTDEYVAAASSVRLRPDVGGVMVAYSAMHGVGGELVARAFEAAGFDRPIPVEEQQQPDGSFPTVSYPNPEEPGSINLLLELAARESVDLAIANDPDADRLAAAIPQSDGSWRQLSGDELGWLFADHILRHTSGDDRLVVTTLVSSSLLMKMAARYGVNGEETFTGFKWIGRVATEREQLGQRFVFGYEQALGYLVTDRPLDKDGISAAVMVAEIAALALAEGITIQDRLDDIVGEYGRHITAERSLKMSSVDGAAWIKQFEVSPPNEVGGRMVETVQTYPSANLLRLTLSGDVRVQIRPSGTEPKIKLYGEGIDIDPAELQGLLNALNP